MSDSDQAIDVIEEDAIVLDDMYLGEEIEYFEVSEEDDYIIVGDPLLPDQEDAWSVIILKGEYKDWVVRFPEITLDKGELQFTYEVLHLPEDAVFTDVDVANYMSSVLSSVLADLHGTEGAVYVDQETGEQVLDH